LQLIFMVKNLPPANPKNRKLEVIGKRHRLFTSKSMVKHTVDDIFQYGFDDLDFLHGGVTAKRKSNQ